MMNELFDTPKKNILDDKSLKENPFSMPEGYLSSLEESVLSKIHTPSQESKFMRIWNASKASVALAASFLILLGIGYGILSLTPLLDKTAVSAESDEFAVLVENGYINNNFIDYLYDEISLEDLLNSSGFVIPDDYSSTIEENISEREMLEYLGIDVPEDK